MTAIDRTHPNFFVPLDELQQVFGGSFELKSPPEAPERGESDYRHRSCEYESERSSVSVNTFMADVAWAANSQVDRDSLWAVTKLPGLGDDAYIIPELGTLCVRFGDVMLELVYDGDCPTTAVEEGLVRLARCAQERQRA